MAVVDQTPRKTGRRDARITLALPHRQRHTVRVANRIDERADEALLGQLLDVTVAEQPGVLGDELLPYHAGDTGDDRKARSQAIGARRHVTLPATPHHGEAAPHQKPVAGMLGVSTVRRAVEPRHDRLIAAIGHVVHEAAIAALEIERLQDAEVALILNVAAGIARGPVEVVDAGIPARGGFIPMPAFKDKLTDQQVADIANYIRTSWGNAAQPNVTPAMVANMRAAKN